MISYTFDSSHLWKQIHQNALIPWSSEMIDRHRGFFDENEGEFTVDSEHVRPSQRSALLMESEWREARVCTCEACVAAGASRPLG